MTSNVRMSGNARAPARTARQSSPRPRSPRANPPPTPRGGDRELLVPVVRPRPQPHLGRRPLRSPLTMPAPTRTLSVADVHRFVDEQVFPTTASGGPAESQVGIELEWITVARDGRACTPDVLRDLLPDLPGRSRFTFEPGGQLELSGPPAAGLGAAIAAMRAPTPPPCATRWPSGDRSRGRGRSTRVATGRVSSTQPRYRRWSSTSTPRGRPVAR